MTSRLRSILAFASLNKKRVEFEVVYFRRLSITRLSMPITMATTTAAMMPANIGVLSGAAARATGVGAAVTPKAVCADEAK